MADHDYKHGGWKNKYIIHKNKLVGQVEGHFYAYDADGDIVGIGEPGNVIPVFEECDPNAVYFVLRLDEDPHARHAARHYANSVRRENPRFADEILKRVEALAIEHIQQYHEGEFVPVQDDSSCGEPAGKGETMSEIFIREWNRLALDVLDNAKAKGFDSVQHEGISIALMHSELSEALEAYRHGNPTSEHIADFTGVEEELADVVIRVMDHAAARGFRVADAILAKIAFNASRPMKHGGKRY